MEHRNLTIEPRYAWNDAGRLPALARELVDLRLDVIVTNATPPTEAVSRLTTTIPIVTLGAGDLVGSGLARSLARPGGNVTGLSYMTPELSPKWLEILKEVVPTLSRVVVLWFPDNPTHPRYQRELEGAARRIGLILEVVELGAGGLEAVVPHGSGLDRGLLVLPETRIMDHRSRLAELARQRRVPAIFMFREFAEAGFLIAYGPNLLDSWQRAAGHVDKILRGASPADLPIEQPMKFDFVVNLKTAKVIGLSIPPTVLVQADEVIE